MTPSAEQVEDSRAAREAEEAKSAATSESSRTSERTAERGERAERSERAEPSARTSDRGPSGSREGGGSSDLAKLTADLNEASRELATLRAQNARLRAERGSMVSPDVATTPALPAKGDATDEKLAAAVKSYGSLKHELASILAELERAKAESAAATAKLKDVSSRTDGSRATIERLESELRTEKRAREQAERNVTKLEEQLRAVARALGKESGGR